MNRRWFFTLAALGMLAVLVAGIYLVMGMGMGKAGTEKKAPKITLVTPAAPPPPPPPPKFEKKPDPPKEQKEMKLAQPEPQPDAPPPSQDLKMEGAAGSGASAFGAGKVTSDDLSKIGAGKASGTGTGGGGGERPAMFDPYANYMNLAKGELQRFLNKNANLRRRRYALDVHLWVSGTGAVTRFELVGSSGDADTDEAVSQALAALPALSQRLPNNMPQPLRLRITAGS